MNLIYLIKIINLIALIFVPFNFVFGVFGYSNRSGLIYLWLCIMGFIINYFNKKKTRLTVITGVVLFAPLIIAKSNLQLIYLGANCIMTMLVVLKGMNTIKYDLELDIFRKGVYICIGVFILSLFGGIHLFNSYSAYYVIIYLVSSILLLRDIRFMEYNKESMEGKRINYRHSIFIVLISITLSISNVREIVVKIIKTFYNFIINIFMYLFSWLFIGIGYLISILSNIISDLIKSAGVEPKGEELKGLSEKIVLPRSESEVLALKVLTNPWFKIFLKIFVIAIIGFILFKIFSSMVNRENDEEDYSEEKEFISRVDRANRKTSKKFFDFIKPRSSNDQIRRYYQKYMKKCIDNGIEISECDTTEEIGNKSRKRFDNTIIQGIRDIYIKIRYGEKDATKEIAKEMAEYYNNIKKQ